MKIKYFLLPAMMLFVAGCVQTKQTDATKPVQQLTSAVTQLDSEVKNLSERIDALESRDNTSGVSAIPQGWQTYQNQELGFSISMPAKWRLLRQTGTDIPEFVFVDCESTKYQFEAAYSDCQRFAIQYHGDEYVKMTDAQLFAKSDLYPSIVELENVIPNARVIKSTGGGGIEFSKYNIDIIFSEAKKSFVFLTSNDDVVESILPTLRLLD